MVLLHEAIEALGIVPWQLVWVGTEEFIERLHKNVEIPARTFLSNCFVDLAIEDVLRSTAAWGLGCLSGSLSIDLGVGIGRIGVFELQAGRSAG